MSELPDWEERCALALNELDRTDLDNATKLTRTRRILTGEADTKAADLRTHVWLEVGAEALPGTDESSPGESIRYRCKRCGAEGHRIVFPTSVTLYPIVSDNPYCD